MPGESEREYRLLRTLAEELKLPLIQIARLAELNEDSSGATVDSIRQTAEMSLKLVEGFQMGLSSIAQLSLDLEPVSVSSILYDTAHSLAPAAGRYNCEIELDISGKYGPVMVNRRGLETALLLIGYSMISGRTTEEVTGRSLILAVHGNKNGLVAGFFDDRQDMTREMFKRGRALLGSARQTLPGALAGSGAGVYIANSLLELMSVPLHLARHQKLTGIATTLTLSKQLQLV